MDAPDTASWAQCVHVCLLVMITSELSMHVFVPDSIFTSTCCNSHALTPLPRLCVALLMPLMPLLGIVCHNVCAAIAISRANEVVVLMPLMLLPSLSGFLYRFVCP